LKKKLDDIWASLDKLEMGLPRIKYDAEDSIILHPFDQEQGGEALVVENSYVSDDCVEVPDTLDAAFKEVGLQAHQDNLELKDVGLLFSLLLGL
jgi:hypothetical protein